MVRVGLFTLFLVVFGVAHAQPTLGASASPSAHAPSDEVTKPWPSPVQHLTVQLPGMSHHFSKPLNKHGREMPGREYNERNWGIGVQLEGRLTGDWDQWVTKTSFGLMKDSLNAMGVYAGHVWQKRMIDGESFTADAGGGGFLFYRTLRFNGPHTLVPAVLPVLSIEHKATQLGMNTVFVPKCKISGGTMPAVIFLQFTKSF
jgi:Antimicrobial peptide resistance and lipid A acylation protein PagP